MFVGQTVILAALAALAYAFTMSLFDLRHGGGRPRDLRHARLGTNLGLVLLGGAVFLLAGAFLIGDVTLGYVWRNVDTRYVWYQRLSGLWIGREGSLLLWTAFTLSFWALEERRHNAALRRGPAHAIHTADSAHPGRVRDLDLDARLADVEANRRIARVILLGLVVAMVAVVASYRPFRDTPTGDLAAWPLGTGVNPQLIIAFNAIHPPVVFIGYALCAIPTAFALAHLATGKRGWLGPARRFALLAFLFLTLGVGLGGLWAYIALGWGGYWAWDPVEVGSIVPWIMVTAFLHAAYRHDQRAAFPIAAPALGALVLPAALFSTFVVRAGGVWVSLHSFIAPGASDSAWQRYLGALATEAEVQLYTGLLVLLLVGLLLGTLRQVQRLDRQERASEPKRDDEPVTKGTSVDESPPAAPPIVSRALGALTLQNLFLVGVLLLTLLATVTVTVLLVGVNGFPSDAVREQVFTERTGPVALLAVTIMTMAIGIGFVPRAALVGLLAGALAVGGIAALVVDAHRALAMAVPILVAAAAMAVTRIALAYRRLKGREATRIAGIHMVHLGLALTLLGHGFVSEFETEYDPVSLHVGEARESGPFLIQLDALTATDTDDNGRLDHVVATLHVWEGERDLGIMTAGFQYYEFQDHYKPQVGVERHLGRDLYFAPAGLHDPDQGWLFGNLPLLEQGGREALEIDGFSFRLSTLPYINLVWGGAAFMVLGSALVAGAAWATAITGPGAVMRPAHRGGTTPSPASAPAPASTRAGARQTARAATCPGAGTTARTTAGITPRTTPPPEHAPSPSTTPPRRPQQT